VRAVSTVPTTTVALGRAPGSTAAATAVAMTVVVGASCWVVTVQHVKGMDMGWPQGSCRSLTSCPCGCR
jgi:hypothetical protein